MTHPTKMVHTPLDNKSIVMDHVSMQYDRVPVLHQVSFTAPPRKTTVLFGPSGAGKSSCLRLIAGFEKPIKGSVFLGSRLVASPDIQMEPKQRRVGYCFQESALWPALTVKKHLEIVIKSRQIKNDSQREAEIYHLLDIFGLTALEERLPVQLSGGEQKRLSFARTLAMDPDYLLLDEPLASVESLLRETLMRFIHECMKRGKTVLSVTHQLDEAFAIADQIVVLVGGMVLRSGTPEEVFNHPQKRSVAELMGYRNFFELRPDGNRVHTPVGCWDDWNLDAPISVALLPEDIQVELDETGSAIVQTCRCAGRFFRNMVQIKGQVYEAVSDRYIPDGSRITFKILRKPRVIQD